MARGQRAAPRSARRLQALAAPLPALEHPLELAPVPPEPLLAAVMDTRAVAVWPEGCEGLVPRTVKEVEAAAAVPAGAVRVRTEVFPAVTVGGAKVPWTPEGSPLTARVTVSAFPAATPVVAL